MAPETGPDTYERRDLTTISYRKRELVMYPVQRQEFEILASGYSSIHLGLFGGFLGVTSTIGVTLATVPLSESMATRFWTGLFIFGAFSLYCGLMAVRDYRKSQAVLSTIKSETVDVVLTDGASPKGSAPESSSTPTG
jgi:hypothetical protein